MSKFNVGDKVMLSPESRWVGSNSDQPDSTNPTGIVGEITKEHDYAHEEDSSFHWCVDWVNGTTNTYHSEDLILVDDIVENTTDENLHSIIEEQESHIANLEEALEMVQKELIELREKLEVQGSADTKDTTEQFKPISEYTIEDWAQAKAEGWVFEMGDDEVYVKGILEEFKDDKYPVEFNLLESKLHRGTTSLQGYFYSNRPHHSRNIKRRIK